MRNIIWKKRVLAWSVCLCILFLQNDRTESFHADVADDAVRELTWFCDQPYWTPAEWDLSEGTPAARITEETGAAVRYVIPEDNGDGRLSLMLVNNNIPDLISVSDREMAKRLLESGAVWEIGELLSQYLPDSHLLADYPEEIKEVLTERDGGWYCLASDLRSPESRFRYGIADAEVRETQSQVSRYGVIWNRDLLRRLGISPAGLRNKEEILEAFASVTERETMVGGSAVIPVLTDGNRTFETTLPVLYDSFGASWFGEDGEYQERILTEECREALEFFNLLVRRDYLDPELLKLNAYQIGRLLNSGRVLCFIGDISRSGIDDPKEWISAGAILSASGRCPVLGQTGETGFGEMMTFLSKSCEDPQTLARFLDYMTTEEGMERYLASDEGQWWPLLDENWYFSRARSPLSDDNSWKQLLCAFARMPQTERFDRMAVELLTWQSGVPDLETAVRQCEKKYVGEVLIAETEEEFEAAFEKLREALEQAGIRELQAAKRSVTEQK